MKSEEKGKDIFSCVPAAAKASASVADAQKNVPALVAVSVSASTSSDQLASLCTPASTVMAPVSAASHNLASSSTQLASLPDMTSGWKTGWLDGVKAMGLWGRFLSRTANAHVLSYLRPYEVGPLYPLSLSILLPFPLSLSLLPLYETVICVTTVSNDLYGKPPAMH